MNPVIRKLHEAQLRKDLPDFRPGDTVRVNVRLLEGEGEKVKDRVHRRGGQGRCAPFAALLPAEPEGQGRPHQARRTRGSHHRSGDHHERVRLQLQRDSKDGQRCLSFFVFLGVC
jgi:hypothetical protein